MKESFSQTEKGKERDSDEVKNEHSLKVGLFGCLGGKKSGGGGGLKQESMLWVRRRNGRSGGKKRSAISRA